ncbi:hypothetical protein J6590_072609 [Homalodisca vitripennis]|nr:hypothetical protein J6590_072609 [Homalodisca vitripennis]
MSVSAFSSFPFAKDESVVSVQRAFRRRFGIYPPSPKNISRWYRQFEEKGRLCKGKSSGRPRTSDEMVETVYGPFFFEGDTVNGMSYLQMLQNWLFPQLQADSGDFIFQQDGAQPHWHNNVRQLLNNTLLDRAHGTSRQCPSLLASKITRLDPMRLFLVRICEGKSVCSPSNS